MTTTSLPTACHLSVATAATTCGTPHGRPIDRGLLAAIMFIGCMGPATGGHCSVFEQCQALDGEPRFKNLMPRMDQETGRTSRRCCSLMPTRSAAGNAGRRG